MELDAQLAGVESRLTEKCMEIPHAEKILEISGVGERILTGILAEIGDVSRFDDVKEIQKLSGLGLVACSSGKHKGKTKISHRGRKRLRYWLFQAGKSAVVHSEEFRELHAYYTTRRENPLKKMQSLIVIACKMFRVIYTILTKGTDYDPKKMLKDIKRPMKQEAGSIGQDNLFLNIPHDGTKIRRNPMMRENQKGLDGLIQEVMDQMHKRKYGKKIFTRYRSSFQLLIYVSHDMGDKLSEKLIKNFSG